MWVRSSPVSLVDMCLARGFILKHFKTIIVCTVVDDLVDVDDVDPMSYVQPDLTRIEVTRGRGDIYPLRCLG